MIPITAKSYDLNLENKSVPVSRWVCFSLGELLEPLGGAVVLSGVHSLHCIVLPVSPTA